MKELSGKRILVTGVGIRPADFVFKDITTGEPSHTPVMVDGIEHKANIGAATAMECAKAGAVVHLVARNQNKLKAIKKWIENEAEEAIVEYSALDLNDKNALHNMLDVIPSDLPLYWVQSVGLGAGTVQVKNENPYLLIDDLSTDLIEAELSVLENTVTMLQLLLPRFRNQEETRVCVITSMSAVRSVACGSMHMAAKGAISRFTNAAMIELDPQRIYITDVRPGGTDTGLYDDQAVRNTVEKMAASYGTDWSSCAGGPRLAPPSAVGQAISAILASKAHITSINIVARGQWPHEGS
jgi:short-subunit dehydrogenase